MIQPRIPISRDQIGQFCARWGITELALFGSVLREDFADDSDVDVLVSFSDDADWGLLDLVRMEEELEELFGRSVDLVTRSSIERSENWIRREAILSSAEPIHAD